MSRGALALGLLFLPQSAWACAVCGEAAEATRGALLGSTIVLSLLPLFLIFGGAGFLWWYAGKPTFEERHSGQSS